MLYIIFYNPFTHPFLSCFRSLFSHSPVLHSRSVPFSQPFRSLFSHSRTPHPFPVLSQPHPYHSHTPPLPVLPQDLYICNSWVTRERGYLVTDEVFEALVKIGFSLDSPAFYTVYECFEVLDLVWVAL
ncbi:uncharacterized protein LOC133793837 isoform X2 [Humulus lupulus]|uniref:uncharacterized protein LOC133793837 isoform X2 n=1 Tax=Humulus lupulus TaxID=3486 RepID=UPI002B411660|nr:uncharacterized protein LOC133793837 isoform X2 [Humulus lupulus]